MQVLTEKLRAPELRVASWLNTQPLTLTGLRGRVVLVDFWDYTCINCLHTLPYLKEWHACYADAGLTVLGLHAPEFAFAKDAERVRQAVERLEIAYPVALDNDFLTWNGFANRAWPAKYLIDPHGYIRAFHHGEGSYREFELLIQALLRECNPDQVFPDPMPVIRDVDQPGAACYRPTPELYLGYGRGEFGNPEGNPPERLVTYADPPNECIPETLYLQGDWWSRKEYIESAGGQAAQIHLQYRAAQVNLVLAPVGEGPLIVKLLLDDQPLPPNIRGEDVALLDGQSVIMVDAARLYRLLSHTGFESHRLSLSVSQEGLRAYAFTFVGCLVSS